MKRFDAFFSWTRKFAFSNYVKLYFSVLKGLRTEHVDKTENMSAEREQEPGKQELIVKCHIKLKQLKQTPFLAKIP